MRMTSTVEQALYPLYTGMRLENEEEKERILFTGIYLQHGAVIAGYTSIESRYICTGS
jgi:hypothetical protein